MPQLSLYINFSDLHSIVEALPLSFMLQPHLVLQQKE